MTVFNYSLFDTSTGTRFNLDLEIIELHSVISIGNGIDLTIIDITDAGTVIVVSNTSYIELNNALVERSKASQGIKTVSDFQIQHRDVIGERPLYNELGNDPQEEG